MAPLVLWGWLMDGLTDCRWGGGDTRTNPHSADRSVFSSWYSEMSGIFCCCYQSFPAHRWENFQSAYILYYWIFYPQNILLCFQKKYAKMALKIFDFDFWSIIWFFFLDVMRNILAFHAWREPQFIMAKSLKGKSTLVSNSVTDWYQFMDESISCIPKENTFWKMAPLERKYQRQISSAQARTLTGNKAL